MNVKSRNYQRKWRYSRSKNPAWEAVLALVVAVAAHILFFGVFKYKEQQSIPQKQGSRITLFNLSSLSERERTQSEKWLKLHDPKLAVRGDSPIGFVPETKNRRISVKEFYAQPDLPQVKLAKYVPIKTRKAEIRTIPEVSVPQKKNVSGAVVLDGRGRVISVDLGSIKSAAAGTSCFAVRGKGLLKRIEIIQSCAAKQDELAANILLNADLKENEKITVVWMGDAK